MTRQFVSPKTTESPVGFFDDMWGNFSRIGRLVVFAVVFAGTPCLTAQDVEKPTLRIGDLADGLRLDGLLDEDMWQSVRSTR